ncbi:glycosyltransferase family 4 protein [Pseudomonas sp. 210_17 TE3656]
MSKSNLLVSFYAPSRGHAGGLRLLDLYRELRVLSPQRKFVLVTVDRGVDDWGVEASAEIFDEIHRIPPEKFNADYILSIDFINAEFDFIDLQYHQCGVLINSFKKAWPNATVAFSPMESMLRSFRSMLTEGPIAALQLKEMAANLWHCFQEVCYVRASHRVITVSDPDRDVITWFKPRDKVFCVPTGLSATEFPDENLAQPVGGSSTVVFFAFFGSKTNREGLIWYCQNVHPLVRIQVPGYSVRVVGRGLEPELMELCACDGVEFLGEVNSISDGLNGADVGIAPALGGAGVRGKIHQYSTIGIPCVASPLACEGLDYRHGESILVAGNASAFASACARLLKEPALRHQIGSRAREVCHEQYSWPSMRQHIASAYNV